MIELFESHISKKQLPSFLTSKTTIPTRTQIRFNIKSESMEELLVHYLNTQDRFTPHDHLSNGIVEIIDPQHTKKFTVGIDCIVNEQDGAKSCKYAIGHLIGEV